MKRLGLPMQKLKAIFVSHEHSDHIRGVEVLSRKYKLPVYITSQTAFQGRLQLETAVPFSAFEPVQVGQLQVKAFPKFHDAAEPHSFVVSCKGVNVGVFTDIGTICQQVTYHFKQCHAVFMEANYDDEMLMKGRYPFYLKSRIRGGRGHLSNAQALQVFIGHRPPFMSHLLLSHLSKDNNCPDLVQQLFGAHARGTEIIIASRDQETGVYRVDALSGDALKTKKRVVKEALQLSLFR